MGDSLASIHNTIKHDCGLGSVDDVRILTAPIRLQYYCIYMYIQNACVLTKVSQRKCGRLITSCKSLSLSSHMLLRQGRRKGEGE